MTARLVLLAAALMALVPLVGCGGGGGTDPAGVAPAGTGFYVEGVVEPQGDLKANLESLAKRVAGIPDLGGKILSELERSALEPGRPIDFEKEVEPWLGERVGIALPHYDGSDFGHGIVALQVTDRDEAERFVEKREAPGDREEPVGLCAPKKGVVCWFDQRSGDWIGFLGSLLVVTQDEASFKAAFRASEGESLADQDRFTAAMDAAPSGSLADLYVDIGGLIEQAGGAIDAEQKLFFEFTGIQPQSATAVASLIPHSDQVEVDFSSNLVAKDAAGGDASKLLGSLPARSVVAVVTPEYGRVFGEGIDQLDAKGIPGQVPPHQFKKVLGEAGIDIGAIADSIGDVGAFVEGSDERGLGAAAVLESKSAAEAGNTVQGIGLLLRAAGTPGVTAIGGKVSGFSIRGDELGPKPLILAAGKSSIVIAYGLPAAAKALKEGSARTLAGDPAYREAAAALGETPISGFVDGPAAVRLALGLVPKGERGFEEALPYLEKIRYGALGYDTSGDLATAKLILGL
ncbi:MAG TPA: DUF3352 domain-containing protein [Solirubrobacterales bacterium]|jgi:hypothetical protein|nr:DUF3352 domain-containing protein [Solirubrobacterales bacterium]